MVTDYIELQSVLLSSKFNGTNISDIEEKNNRVYFTINGHKFNTYASYIYSKGHPLFEHAVTDIGARKHNTAEGIEEDEKWTEKLNQKWDVWDKHKASIYKLLFLRGLEIMNEKGDEEFVKFINHHLNIYENDDNCQELIKILEDKSK